MRLRALHRSCRKGKRRKRKRRRKKQLLEVRREVRGNNHRNAEMDGRLCKYYIHNLGNEFQLNSTSEMGEDSISSNDHHRMRPTRHCDAAIRSSGRLFPIHSHTNPTTRAPQLGGDDEHALRPRRDGHIRSERRRAPVSCHAPLGAEPPQRGLEPALRVRQPREARAEQPLGALRRGDAEAEDVDRQRARGAGAPPVRV